MANTKGCPLCGAPVTVKNLPGHLRKVHPAAADAAVLAQADEAAESVGGRRSARPRPREVPWKLVAFAVVMVLIFVGIGYLLSRPPEGLGSPAPDFTVVDTESQVFELSSFAGRPVVVYVMRGTWCTICSANVPTLKDAWSEYKDQGLIMISVNLDRTESVADLAGYKEDHGAEWRFAPDTDEVLTKYRVRDAGATYFINRDGTIADYLSGVYGGDRMRPILEKLVEP